MEDSLNVEGHHSFSFKGELYEGFHDGVSDFHSDYLTDRQSPSADQVYVPYYDIDTKWRSISVAHPSPSLFRAHGHVVNDGSKRSHPDPVKCHAKKIFDSSVASSTEIGSSTSVNEAKAPSQPFLLMKTHFETNSSLKCIKATIRDAFALFPEISYDVEVDCTVSVRLRTSAS